MIWKTEEHEEYGTLEVLEGHRSLATVRQDEKVGHTVVTISVLLPLGDIDTGKDAANRLMSTAIAIERGVKS